MQYHIKKIMKQVYCEYLSIIVGYSSLFYLKTLWTKKNK